MDERVVQFRIGMMVLATVIIAGILVATFGELPLPMQSEYTVYVKFPQAPGVSRKSPIRKSGILVGRVTDVELLSDGDVKVTARVEKRYALRHDEVCWLKPTILGDAMLEFIRSDDPGLRPTIVADGDWMVGVVRTDPLQVISDMEQDMSSAISSVAKTSDEMGQMVREMNELLRNNQQRMNSIVVKTDETLTSLRDLVRNTNEVAGDPQLKARVKETAEEIPAIMADVRTTLDRMNETLRLASENLENMKGFTEPLAQSGPQLAVRMSETAGKLDALLDELVVFSKALNNPDGSLGQLTRDKELYTRMTNTLANVEDLTQRMKPILADARVLTDKLARRPEQLGVAGALRPSSGAKPVPSFQWGGAETGSESP